jgi:hypothetical protein
MIPPPDDIPATVRALGRVTIPELKQRYADFFCERTRSGKRDCLVRRIALRLQARAEGNLSERARPGASTALAGTPASVLKAERGGFEPPIQA